MRSAARPVGPSVDLDANAVAVLELVDGQRSVRAIAALLGEKFTADPAVMSIKINNPIKLNGRIP